MPDWTREILRPGLGGGCLAPISGWRSGWGGRGAGCFPCNRMKRFRDLVFAGARLQHINFQIKLLRTKL